MLVSPEKPGGWGTGRASWDISYSSLWRGLTAHCAERGQGFKEQGPQETGTSLCPKLQDGVLHCPAGEECAGGA